MCTVQLFGARTFKMVLFLKPNVGNTQPRSECNVMWIRKYLLLSVTECALLWVSVLISEVNWQVQGSLVQCQVFTDISVLISDWTGTTVSIWTYKCDFLFVWHFGSKASSLDFCFPTQNVIIRFFFPSLYGRGRGGCLTQPSLWRDLEAVFPFVFSAVVHTDKNTDGLISVLISVMLGLCWAMVGLCWAMLGLCWAMGQERRVHLGHLVDYLGSYFLGKKPSTETLGCWGFFLGRFGAMLGQCWAHVGPMLGLCWTMLCLWGPCCGHLEPILSLCWAYVGPRTVCSCGPLCVVGLKNIFIFICNYL